MFKVQRILHVLPLLGVMISGIVLSNNYGNPDYGGNRGYSLSFHDYDNYLGVSSYFTSNPHWPTNSLTVSAWIRVTSWEVMTSRSFIITVSASQDQYHVQPFEIDPHHGKNNLPQFGSWTSLSGWHNTLNTSEAAMVNSYWTKVTYTYNSTGKISMTYIYFNGTLLGRNIGTGGLLRFVDQTAFNIGGYPNGDRTAFSGRQRFYGWLDDLAMYNRVQTDTEIAANWMKVVDVSDPSLFIYYNFDEGPGSTIIHNLGAVGSQANLVNGAVLGSGLYTETDSQTIRNITKASFSPGAPLVGATVGTPLVYAIDATTSVQFRVSCLSTASTTGSTSITPTQPTQATFTAFSNYGLLYQADTTHTPITTYPTQLTSSTGYFRYTASASPLAGSSINGYPVDTISYSCVCNGLSQTGTIQIITNVKMVPDPAIMATVIFPAHPTATVTPTHTHPHNNHPHSHPLSPTLSTGYLHSHPQHLPPRIRLQPRGTDHQHLVVAAPGLPGPAGLHESIFGRPHHCT